MALETAVSESLGPLPPGRHGLSRKHVAASQRARLMQAIVDAVGRKGYAATTIADVNSLADVSKKTFYVHFKDKEDCFLAAYEAFAHYILEEMTTAAERTHSGGWRVGYRANTRKFLALLADRPARAQALMLNVLAAGPNALARRREVLKTFINMLRFVHATARSEEPDVVDLPQEIFELTVYGVDEWIRNYILEDRIGELPKLANAITSNVEWLFKNGQPRGNKNGANRKGNGKVRGSLRATGNGR